MPHSGVAVLSRLRTQVGSAGDLPKIKVCDDPEQSFEKTHCGQRMQAAPELLELLHQACVLSTGELRHVVVSKPVYALGFDGYLHSAQLTHHLGAPHPQHSTVV